MKSRRAALLTAVGVLLVPLATGAQQAGRTRCRMARDTGRRRLALARTVLASVLLGGCAPAVNFPSAFPTDWKLTTPPVHITGTLLRPEGLGPFPAMVLLHACAGVRPNHQSWAPQLADQV